ncbi:MAG TPA: hypothetical protein VHA52_03380, partial [Candidatus Babeliaceae bacterium]|nr:hypothetical protein [Candidatus Babeliaceae bacterium]
RLKAAVIESPEGNLANLDLYGIPEDLPILLVAYPDTAQNKENITKLYRQLKWLGLTDVYAITPKNSQEYTQAAHAFYGFYDIPHDAALAQEGEQQLLQELQPLSVEQKGQNWAEWIPLVGTLGAAVASLPVLKKIYKTYKRWTGTGSGDGGSPIIPRGIAETQKASTTAAGTSEGVGLMPGNPAEITVEPVLGAGTGLFISEALAELERKELELTADQKIIRNLIQKLEPKLLKIMEIQQQLVGQLPSLLNKSSADIDKIINDDFLKRLNNGLENVWFEFDNLPALDIKYSKTIEDTNKYIDRLASLLFDVISENINRWVLLQGSSRVEAILADITELERKISTIQSQVTQVLPQIKQLIDSHIAKLLRSIKVDLVGLYYPSVSKIKVEDVVQVIGEDLLSAIGKTIDVTNKVEKDILFMLEKRSYGETAIAELQRILDELIVELKAFSDHSNSSLGILASDATTRLELEGFVANIYKVLVMIVARDINKIYRIKRYMTQNILGKADVINKRLLYRFEKDASENQKKITELLGMNQLSKWFRFLKDEIQVLWDQQGRISLDAKKLNKLESKKRKEFIDTLIKREQEAEKQEPQVKRWVSWMRDLIRRSS